MCRMTFAAIAATVAFSPLRAQQVPARDLYDFPIATLAEAPALASAAGGGFWNPATIALSGADRALLSVSALKSPIEQGVSAQVGTAALRIGRTLTAGISVAQASVSDLLRTDTDPQSIGGEIPYRSTIVSGLLASRHGPATFGVALRRRSAAVDNVSGGATSADLGGTLERPAGLPLRLALASFLRSTSGRGDRTATLSAVEGILPFQRADLRTGIAYQSEREGPHETFVYASGRTSVLDLRAGVARQTGFGNTTTRTRLGLGVRSARYLVGVAREDGTAGLGATYQFLLTTVYK
jgi:hypothetical protein